MTSLRRLASGAAAALTAAAVPAHASFLSGDALDSVADVMAWVVLIVVPIVVIAVFWIVHVLPEKIAHQRHHPQYKAIQVLCLLSLVFGGLLWPIAWIWAYTRPVIHRMAYGTDRHDDYFVELGEKVRRGEALDDEIAALKHELDALHARGPLPSHLQKLRDDIAALQAGGKPAAPAPRTGPAAEPELERRGA
jgi:CBS domain containing-hemolysin-like protein